MTDKEIIKIYSSELQDLIYNFKPDAWKYLSDEQQKVIQDYKDKIIELIKKQWYRLQ